jgi:hypothetical protein
MGALYQDRLADWPSVVTKTQTQTHTTEQFSVGDSHLKFVDEEELKTL